MSPRRSESRLGVLVGLMGAAALHAALWLALPSAFFEVAPGTGAVRYQDFSIELEGAASEEVVETGVAAGFEGTRMVFTETSGVEESAEPGATDRFGVVSQSARSSAEGAIGVEAEDAGGELYNAVTPLPEALPEPVDPVRTGGASVAATLGLGEGGKAGDWRTFFEGIKAVTAPVRETVELVQEEEVEEEDVYAVEDAPEETIEPEEGRVDGYGEPLPRPRLEQLPLGARRPLLSDAARYGSSRLAVRRSPWGLYSKSMTDRIRTRFDGYLAELPASERGGYVKVHFTLRPDGSVGAFEVETIRGSETFRAKCVASVQESQPFGAWSSTLVDLYGQGHRVTYEFFYDSEGGE